MREKRDATLEKRNPGEGYGREWNGRGGEEEEKESETEQEEGLEGWGGE